MLKNLGLNNNEVKIYLTCLSLGRTLASTIAKKCNINRSSVYTIAEKMINKGFITAYDRNNTRYYEAINTDQLLTKFQIRAREANSDLVFMENAISALKNIERGEKNFKVTFYEGEELLKTYEREILELKETVYSIENSRNIYEFFPDILNEFRSKRIKNGVLNKVICPRSNEYNFNSKKEIREVRYIKDKYHFDGIVLICKDIIGIYYITKDEPKVISIKSSQIANYFKVLFQILWDHLPDN
jgi:sugar-specific transcriptional regulator TrmB